MFIKFIIFNLAGRDYVIKWNNALIYIIFQHNYNYIISIIKDGYNIQIYDTNERISSHICIRSKLTYKRKIYTRVGTMFARFHVGWRWEQNIIL